MNRNGRTDIETPIPGVTLDYDTDALKVALETRGHSVGVIAQESGLSIVQVLEGKSKKHGEGKESHKHKRSGRTLLIGGADLRRDGFVAGK
jgi:hypothetical protein